MQVITTYLRRILKLKDRVTKIALITAPRSTRSLLLRALFRNTSNSLKSILATFPPAVKEAVEEVTEVALSGPRCVLT